MCDCVGRINASLAESEHPNTMIETPMFGTQVTFVVTCKRKEGVRGKPQRMMASHCPFCGEKYPPYDLLSDSATPAETR